MIWEKDYDKSFATGFCFRRFTVSGICGVKQVKRGCRIAKSPNLSADRYGETFLFQVFHCFRYEMSETVKRGYKIDNSPTLAESWCTG